MLLTIAFLPHYKYTFRDTESKKTNEVLQFYPVISTFCDFVHRPYFKAKANGVV